MKNSKKISKYLDIENNEFIKELKYSQKVETRLSMIKN